MTSTRVNPITGEPVIFAPARASRPGAFGLEHNNVGRCPFCAGHEADTPPPLDTVGNPWSVRVVPNKYPPVAGAEVIVESPRHLTDFSRVEAMDEVVRTYARRYAAHTDAAHVALFRNTGPRAGASFDHVHAQLLPLAFVPPRAARESAGFATATQCPLCAAGDDHRGKGLVIGETASFVWLAPWASAITYEQWIVPKRHVAEITSLTDEETGELARLLRESAAVTESLGADYNVVFMNFRNAPSAHMYVDVTPRLTNLAGFELGSGTFVEIIDPAAAARRLRQR